MKRFSILLSLSLSLCVISFPASLPAESVSQTRPVLLPATAKKSHPGPRLCPDCIRADMEFLASDALRGRGSGTADELVAATYVASQLRAYGIAPAGDNGGYIQRAALQAPKFTAPPQLTFSKPGASEEKVSWECGKEFAALYLSQSHFSGPLRVINADEDDPQSSGAIVLILGNDRRRQRAKASALTAKGAVAAIIAATPERTAEFQGSAQIPTLPVRLEGQGASGLESDVNLLEASPEATTVLEALPENTILSFDGPLATEKKYTWNAVGVLRGSDPKQATAVLLSAHLDHLGIGPPVNGDNIYNGADDDASGTTAVLELARVLGSGPRPRRTVIFALFGSEETGGQGSTFFLQHPPVPLKQIAVNLEFEMLGRADPAVSSDTVWLTGWERSNLGPALAAHGAKLVGDPHPKQNFFARSDNYVLAKKGVVAQTVSSYGLHSDYHQPSDEVSRIDFKHMDAAIASLLWPIRWLVNSSFTPQWNEGGKP
ncbi:MAG: M28 family peptidase [Terriglobales bacterium]